MLIKNIYSTGDTHDEQYIIKNGPLIYLT